MIKLNRTTEYGLIALRHMSRKKATDPQGVTSAREISDFYGLPFEITAKTLQRLKDTGMIHSAQGARGGYNLRCGLGDVTLAKFLEVMEGPQAIVACSPSSPHATDGKAKDAAVGAACGCEYHGRCEIKGLMTDLNSRVLQFLESIHLGELVEGNCPAFANFVSLRKKGAIPMQPGAYTAVAVGEEP